MDGGADRLVEGAGGGRRGREGPEPPLVLGRADLVGAGPGLPDLITQRGAALLARADVVIYDHLVCPRSLALAPPGAELIDAGKSSGHHVLAQSAINALMVEKARRGLRVVRLKGGDPLVFGRGGEEAEALAEAGVPFSIVPGVTAAAGATAYAGVPITHRADAGAVALFTGHEGPEASRLDFKALASFPGTLVAYMGVNQLRAIAAGLVAEGKAPETPAAVIERGALPSQRVLTGDLATIADLSEAAGLRPPALIVVGAVVLRRPRLAWYEALPLFGQRILIARPEGEAEESARRLEELGAEAIVAPMVQIRPLEDFSALDDAIGRLPTFQWLVFTSSNGVKGFLDRLGATGRDPRALGHLKLAAIGPGTARALASEARLRADVVPDDFRSEGLVEALRPLVAGQSVLLARADRGRDLLREELGGLARVEQVAVYRNVDADSLPKGTAERFASGTIDWALLTSSAIARRLAGLLAPEGREALAQGRVKVASLGPPTSLTVRELGWPVAVEAARSDFEGLVEAVVGAVRAPTA